jgi:hypothetical protein
MKARLFTNIIIVFNENIYKSLPFFKNGEHWARARCFVEGGGHVLRG